MDGRTSGVVAPVVGAGGLFGAPMVGLAEHPALAVLYIVLAMVAVLVPIVLVCRLARRVVGDALRRGTQVDLSFRGLQIHVGRNRAPGGSDAEHEEE